MSTPLIPRISEPLEDRRLFSATPVQLVPSAVPVTPQLAVVANNTATRGDSSSAADAPDRVAQQTSAGGGNTGGSGEASGSEEQSAEDVTAVSNLTVGLLSPGSSAAISGDTDLERASTSVLSTQDGAATSEAGIVEANIHTAPSPNSSELASSPTLAAAATPLRYLSIAQTPPIMTRLNEIAGASRTWEPGTFAVSEVVQVPLAAIGDVATAIRNGASLAQPEIVEAAAPVLVNLGRMELATFADAIAAFTHESAAVGTIMAAPVTHFRACAVTALTVGIDAILIGCWRAGRRHTKSRGPERRGHFPFSVRPL